MKAPNKISDLELMLHVDGELEPSESQRLEAHLSEEVSDEASGASDQAAGDARALAAVARAKVLAVRELGDLVRGHVELATDDAEPKLAGMWAELGKRLDNESAPSPRPVSSGGFGKWLSQWFERYRGHLLTGTLSAGAVAALALLLRPGQPEVVVKDGDAPVPATMASAPPEIEALDVPNGTGTVLTLEDEDGAAAIVWVTPDDVEDL